MTTEAGRDNQAGRLLIDDGNDIGRQVDAPGPTARQLQRADMGKQRAEGGSIVRDFPGIVLGFVPA